MARPPLPWAFDLFFLVSYLHHLVNSAPLPLLFQKETENGPPSACVIWLKLLWFPLRKGWQSPQCWLVLKTITCSYLPSWQQVVQAGWSWLAGWLKKLDMADFREIEILWWKPVVNKAVTIGVHRKLLSELAGECVWVRVQHVCICVNACVCSWITLANWFHVWGQFLPVSGDWAWKASFLPTGGVSLILSVLFFPFFFFLPRPLKLQMTGFERSHHLEWFLNHCKFSEISNKQQLLCFPVKEGAEACKPVLEWGQRAPVLPLHSIRVRFLPHQQHA